MLLNGAFGSLYAWSVFVRPLESLLAVSRTEISLVFSIAVVCFTVGNFVSPRMFGKIPAWGLTAIAGALAAGGLGWAAMSERFLPVAIGYGGMFGFACGFAYNVVLQSAAMALGNRPGLANVIVISAFALGSIGASALLGQAVADMGPMAALWLQALVVGGAAVAATVLIALAGIALPGRASDGEVVEDRRILVIAWTGFFLGALSGVMSIGHAAAIIQHFGGGPGIALAGLIALNAGNALGRFMAGWLADHTGVRNIAGAAHLIGTAGFIFALAEPTATGAAVGMASAGLAYGLTAGIYPSTVAIFMDRRNYGHNFALLLTAWGVAGLLGPWLGGAFFDLTHDYRVSLEIACLASALALFNAMRLPAAKLSR